ncbi:MAG: uroporphyrinogen decarboxylase family protein [Phycisphaerae bacterium]
MTDRERFLACILGDPVDRPPYWLFWQPWGPTWRRWQAEGKPAELATFADVRAHFAAEGTPCTLPVNVGPCPKLERTVLGETDEFVTFTDGWGIRRRDFKGHESMSEFLEFPVKGRADWEAFRDRHLDPDDARRIADDLHETHRRWSDEGRIIQLGYYPDCGVFGSLRWLLGDEECLLAFYTDPRLVHEIMDHVTDIYVTVFEKVAAEVRVDVIHIWEDMAGRQGPLIGPAMWEEFMGPCYRRIKALARRHDIPVLSVDTDGRPHDIIPPMMAAGVNYLYPQEVAAGCDVVEMQRLFPGLGMMGGIDKRALAAGSEAIDAELDRVRPAVEAGRYIPDLDHLVPSDVSWENFCHYARALRRLVGKEP